jgi:hypothetical protein
LGSYYTYKICHTTVAVVITALGTYFPLCGRMASTNQLITALVSYFTLLVSSSQVIAGMASRVAHTIRFITTTITIESIITFDPHSHIAVRAIQPWQQVKATTIPATPATLVIAVRPDTITTILSTAKPACQQFKGSSPRRT